MKYIRAYDSIAARNQSFAIKDFENPKGKANKKCADEWRVKNAAIVILSISLVGLFIFIRRKQKKQRSKLRNIIRTQFNMIGNRTHYPLKQSGDFEFPIFFWKK